MALGRGMQRAIEKWENTPEFPKVPKGAPPPPPILLPNQQEESEEEPAFDPGEAPPLPPYPTEHSSP